MVDEDACPGCMDACAITFTAAPPEKKCTTPPCTEGRARKPANTPGRHVRLADTQFGENLWKTKADLASQSRPPKSFRNRFTRRQVHNVFGIWPPPLRPHSGQGRLQAACTPHAYHRNFQLPQLLSLYPPFHLSPFALNLYPKEYGNWLSWKANRARTPANKLQTKAFQCAAQATWVALL